MHIACSNMFWDPSDTNQDVAKELISSSDIEAVEKTLLKKKRIKCIVYNAILSVKKFEKLLNMY